MHRPGIPSRALPASALLLLGLAAGACSVAPGEPEEPAPAVVPEADEAPYLDGSLDGAGSPAGLEELEAGGALEDEPHDGEASPADVPAPTFEEEIREQFGALFLDTVDSVPPEVLGEVQRYVELFHEGRARENFERWLGREGAYRDLILGELRAQGLPDGLLYLAMLESGFSPTVVSRARAVGLWQFMRTTGREAGLRIDDWVDERRDPIASTRAAIAHLRMLHDELGDWALAAAAYNAGLGRVRRAQKGRRTGYFDLVAAGALPAETRSYVPLIIAAGHVAANRHRYGFTAGETATPFAYDSVVVGPRTRLSAVAHTAGVEVDDVKALNPQLIGAATPPGGEWVVRMAVGSLPFDFGDRLASLPREERILPEYRETWWTVKSGDSWWRIAHAHGISVKTLQARNPRFGSVIHPGDRILVERRPIYGEDDLADARASGARIIRTASARAEDEPDATPVGTPVATPTSSDPAPAGSSPRQPEQAASSVAMVDGVYTVRRGDTMTGLAASLGTPVDSLVAWNDMSGPRPLRIGERIRVAPPPLRHRVKWGETLTSVARDYGVSIDDLVRWNELGEARPLREGETLVVRSGGE